MKRRVAIVAALLGLWVTGIEARLVYLQVFQHADLVARAERQQERTLPSPAKRGDILDRHGRVLATSVDADTIYAVPTEIADPADAATKLCDALGDCDAKDRQVARRDGSASGARSPTCGGRSRRIRRERVAALNLDGVGFIKESKRFYPNKELAAHLLGWVGIDNNGLERPRVHLRPADPRQGRHDARCTPTRGGTRSAASSGRRPPGRASS